MPSRPARRTLAAEATSLGTKSRILDAAERLFLEHGFEATSLRQLTAAAGVNLAAVNYHFGSKEELFQAVLTREGRARGGLACAVVRESPVRDADPGVEARA